jgi:hypothetical protein
VTNFAITWDYRCPYARNANEHVIAALLGGSDWDVRFVPFSLDQSHVEPGQLSVWDEPERYPGLLATEVGIVVRHQLPDRFLAVHQAMFTARHDRFLDLRRRDVVAGVLDAEGVDSDVVLAAVDDGWPLRSFQKEHEAAVAEHQVFGVPTFMVADRAVFVRLMTRPDGDGDLAAHTISRVLDLVVGWPDLNEFKHTTVPA